MAMVLPAKEGQLSSSLASRSVPMLRSWWGQLTAIFKPGYLEWRMARRPRRRTTLVIEMLEDRTVPAGIDPGVDWSSIGPMPLMSGNIAISGRVSALAVSDDFDLQTPGNQPAMFLGSAGGAVWRSTNFTAAAAQVTWTNVTDFLGLTELNADPTTAHGAGASDIGSIAAYKQFVYAATGEANYVPGDVRNLDAATTRYGSGILFSDKGGNPGSWTLLPVDGVGWDFFRSSISKIIIDPTNDAANAQGATAPGKTLYIAVVPPDGESPHEVVHGIFKSRDGGMTWTKVSGGQTGIDELPVITDLEYVVDGNQLVLFGAAGNISGNEKNGMWRGIPHANGGVSWTKLQLGNPVPQDQNNKDKGSAIGRITLATDDHKSVLYVLLGIVTK
jgi:hypothetical protein